VIVSQFTVHSSVRRAFPLYDRPHVLYVAICDRSQDKSTVTKARTIDRRTPLPDWFVTSLLLLSLSRFDRTIRSWTGTRFRY